jgi:hypothetical protein
VSDTKTRPTIKHVLTATAFQLVMIRNCWREYVRGVRAERRARAEQYRRGDW